MNSSSVATTIEQPGKIMLTQRAHLELEDDQVGPVFVELPDQMGWVKVNNFSACDQCRTSHVKCSLSVTGGPCNHCEHKYWNSTNFLKLTQDSIRDLGKNRNQLCKVYGWVFNPESPAYHIYKPVLPPPAAAPPSPPDSSPTEGYRFQWESLVQKLTWLQREAPRKFRKRSTAMPWRDEPSLEENSDYNRKRSSPQQVEEEISSAPKLHLLNQENQQGSISEGLPKRRRIAREAKPSHFESVPPAKETVKPITQHRMSISYILSPCNFLHECRFQPKV
ncbi:hypothetical protein MJO29_003771 [Puccinia striiformis f. sp. tritici]|nr:hypothetical protein MJO29_003771 [Puccinia striiformis f. sp. tritici]